MAARPIRHLSDTLDQASDDLEAQIEGIKDDFSSLRDTIGQVLSKSSSILSSQLSTARDAVKQKAGNLLQAGQEAADYGLERAKEHEADFEEIVQLHPIVAVAAAVGIGLLVGVVLTSGSRK